MADETPARNLIREGRISVVYPERHSARVEFEDKDGLISAELPVLTTFALQNKSYALPDVNETVVCIFTGNADNTGTGFIIGSRYHDKSTPAVKTQDKTRLDFADGTFIEYDRASHELKINCVGNVRITGKAIYLN